MGQNTATPPSARSVEQVERAKTVLREIIPEDGTLYSYNHGTSQRPKMTCYAVFNGEIQRVTNTVAQATGLKWNNSTGFLYGFRTGGENVHQYVADALAKSLGYANLVGRQL